MTTAQDKEISELLTAIEKKTAALKELPRKKFITNCKISIPGLVNLRVCNDPVELCKALQFLLKEQAFLEEAASILEVEPPTFVWAGYKFEDWKHDIKAQMQEATYRKQKIELDAAMKALEELYSAQAKTKMAIDKIKGKIAGALGT